MPSAEEDIREALEQVLSLYDVKLDFDAPLEGEDDEKKAERYGDYSRIIGKTQQKLDDLTEKAEAIFQRTGMDKDQLEAYAANPNNFTREQWEALQKVKEACEKYKREARSKIPDEKFEQKIETQQKKKQTHRFAKKKHWIPL